MPENQDLAFAAKDAFQLKSDVTQYQVLPSDKPPSALSPKDWVHDDPVPLIDVVWVPKRHYLLQKMGKKKS